MVIPVYVLGARPGSPRLMSDAGVDGLVLSWPGYESGIEQFAQKVLPLLKQSGLR